MCWVLSLSLKDVQGRVHSAVTCECFYVPAVPSSPTGVTAAWLRWGSGVSGTRRAAPRELSQQPDELERPLWVTEVLCETPVLQL